MEKTIETTNYCNGLYRKLYWGWCLILGSVRVIMEWKWKMENEMETGIIEVIRFNFMYP